MLYAHQKPYMECPEIELRSPPREAIDKLPVTTQASELNLHIQFIPHKNTVS
jgi:hypothetical protein